MGKKPKVLIILFIFITLLTGIVNGTSYIEINELIENTRELDEKEVTIQGEAIGEALERGDYAWVNINDGTNAIGIWLTIEDANLIKTYGDYKHKGDIIKIKGIFSRACIEHGGDIDVHNISLEIIEEGYEMKETVTQTKIVTAVTLNIIAVIVAYFFYRIMKKPIEV
ncbi:MAG: DNA-binding protein [Firmicutes bacterium HGW-Firmicutes-1]|jgi:hypothetical protein|nr:MAG: DNA-binding protein [Firmicutes bacterium HGW-Firmicutes-1]